MTRSWGRLRSTASQLGTVPLLLRGLALVSSCVAVLTTTLPSWDVADAYVYVAVAAALAAATVPDSGGGLFFAAAIVVSWVTGSADPVVGPSLVATTLALLVGHVATALAAAMPSNAVAPIGLLARWWRPTTVIAAAVVVTAGGVRLLAAWDLRGSVVVVVAALAVAGAGVWRWSAVGGDGPPA